MYDCYKSVFLFHINAPHQICQPRQRKNTSHIRMGESGKKEIKLYFPPLWIDKSIRGTIRVGKSSL